jgi:PGF-CTERM protein
MDTRHAARRIALVVAVVAATLALGGLATAPAAAQQTSETTLGATQQPNATAAATGDQLAQQETEGWDVVQDFVFADDGSIQMFRLTVSVSDESYQQFEAAAEQEGYESGADWFANFFADETDGVTTLREVNTEGTSQGQIIVATYDADISASDNTTARVQNGRLTVETVNVANPNESGTLDTLVHRYYMPGEVVDSNADAVNGSVAVWALHQNPQSTLRVTSQTSATAEPDDGDQQQSDGFDLAYNLTVGSDGTVEEMEISLDVTDETYQQFQEAADNQGFDTGAEVIATQLVTGEEGFVDYSNPRDVDSEKGTRLVFAVDVNASVAENLTITREDGAVILRQSNLEDPAEDRSITEVTYRYRMPGEIAETNAIETRGNTAIYRLHEEYVSQLEVRANVSSSSMDNGTDADDDEDSGGGASGPGFGVAVTLIAALVAALALARRS